LSRERQDRAKKKVSNITAIIAKEYTERFMSCAVAIIFGMSTSKIRRYKKKANKPSAGKRTVFHVT